ncbi:6-phosphogluconolactonase [Hydrogenovibrio halophilus]|uniref:6-phosphogluconolactonase n=1 Tax=Hydrogenovibrio halophilus TaxID=373391 RepID=UPI00037CB608|nr:6-phosphogluconolactonase [Hydrogenovibrio halophilus]
MTEINSLPDNWVVFDQAEELSEALCQRLLTLAEDAIRQRGTFHLVLAGGTTPLQTYRRLAQAKADWSHWYVYLGDERVLPVDDPERNSVQIDQAWLSRVPIPSRQIHWIPTELGLTLAQKAYQHSMDRLLATQPFDVVLLGMGEDGHTASLFPGHTHDPDQKVVTESHSPKPPSERVSLNDCALAQTRHLFKIVTGASKRDAVAEWLEGVSLPISRIKAEPVRQSNWHDDCQGETQVWIDSQAL